MADLVNKLSPEQKERIKKSSNAMVKQRRNVTRRARKELLEMSDAEWQRLVDEANGDE